MPIAKEYEPDAITHAGHLVAFNGAMFQALRDTARRPGVGGDWLCVARGGKDGRDGKSIVFRGGFDACDAYAEGDLVAYEGQTFTATRDSPTGIPSDGEGWALFAARGAKGERGAAGLRGHKGDRGPSGAKPVQWRLAKEYYCAIPFLQRRHCGAEVELAAAL
jgi:hypothetical protein